jgi:hypothetical protein
VQQQGRQERRDPYQVPQVGLAAAWPHRPDRQQDDRRDRPDPDRRREPVADQPVPPLPVVPGREDEQHVTDERPVEEHDEVRQPERQDHDAGPVQRQQDQRQDGVAGVGARDDELVGQARGHPPGTACAAHSVSPGSGSPARTRRC